jgi:hypothetical protein
VAATAATAGCSLALAAWLAKAQNPTLAAAGRTAHKAMAFGTLALLIGEQAAEGQTARLSREAAPIGDTKRLSALGISSRSQCRLALRFGRVHHLTRSMATKN